MRFRHVIAAFVVASCSRNPPPTPQPQESEVIQQPRGVDAAVAPPKYRTGESKTYVDPGVVGTSKKFMVSSEAPQATKVGRDILAAGGNAVDAAVATAFALAVVHPSAGNIGGGGFAVVRLAPGKAVALDFREVAPAAATETMYIDPKTKQPTDESRIGHKASGVPGTVAGLYELHKKYGKLPWKDVVAPAVKLAKDGFDIDAVLAASLMKRVEKLKKFPNTAAIWLGTRPPNTKHTIPALAQTLERIAQQGADGFYKGVTAELIAAEMKAGNGIITMADLAAYKAVWRDPLRFSYRGNSLVSMPPPSSGGIVLAMTAGMLRDHDLSKMTWHDEQHVHLLVEVWRRAFAARNQVLGDPDFVKDIPIKKLTSEDYLKKLAATITDDATPSKNTPVLLDSTQTTNLCTVDASGMAVALTTTLNGAFGSYVTVKDAGFLMNNEMDDFAVKPGSPNMFGLVQGAQNKIEPGKRMLSSMTPTIVEDGKGEVILLAGAGGGPRIITGVWQTISNVVDFGQSIDVAVANPRIHHQHLPDKVGVEAESIDEATSQALSAHKYNIDWGDAPIEFAHVTAIARTATGWQGTADQRNGGAAMGD
jgi:gamma-glutamyltranspeptidase / glutathione hydrolase